MSKMSGRRSFSSRQEDHVVRDQSKFRFPLDESPFGSATQITPPDIELPNRGAVYRKTGSVRPEWWRVTDCEWHPGDVLVTLARIDDKRQQTCVRLAELSDPRKFERVEARYSENR
jgi:hypothetical protein